MQRPLDRVLFALTERISDDEKPFLDALVDGEFQTKKLTQPLESP